MTFCYLAAFNWWLLLCPATLSHDWQMGSVPLVTSPEDSRNLLTCLCFVLVLLLFARSLLDFEVCQRIFYRFTSSNNIFRNKLHVNVCMVVSYIQSQESAPIILGLLMLVLPFVPAANLFVTVGFVIAERILYIPRYI